MEHALLLDKRKSAPAPISPDNQGHAFRHVNISGNATVQLGDKYGSELQSPAESTSQYSTDFLFLGTGTALFDLIDFSYNLFLDTKVFNTTQETYLEQLHFSSASDALRKRCLSLSTNVDSLPQNVGVAGDVLRDTVVKCSEIVEELERVLSQSQSSASTMRHPSFFQAAQRLWQSDWNQKMSLLTSLRAKILFALLIVFRQRSMKEQNEFDFNFSKKRLKAEQHSQQSILKTIQSMEKAHPDIVHELGMQLSLLSQISSDNLSRLEPDFDNMQLSTNMVIEEWYTRNSHILVEYADRVSRRLTSDRNLRVRQLLIKSLAFPEMDHRYHAIHHAAKNTLDWILDESSNFKHYPENFAKWLQNDDVAINRLYWISGKPGSGKSTLMRHLTDSQQTTEVAAIWAGNQNLLTASSFFWNSGTNLQKSQKGLLQTLLHQLLTQHHSFDTEICHHRSIMHDFRGSSYDDLWTLPELRDTLFAFIQHHTNDAKVFIVVDGLDEFEGSKHERQEICSLLKILSANPVVKICASSRPWNVYTDAFKNSPNLRLELLTRSDIYNFVEGSFCADDFFKSWADSDPSEANKLVVLVVERAQGVFLWVRLVVRSLLAGLQDGDNARDLLHKLNEIPTDLEDYFLQLMKRLQPEYLKEAAQIFKLSLAQNDFLARFPLVMIYHFAFEMKSFDGTLISREQLQISSLGDARKKQAIQQRRIRARCVDLFEFRHHWQSTMRYLKVVEYIHRTAKDFIASPPIQTLLESWQDEHFDVQEALLYAFVGLSICSGSSSAGMSDSCKAECLVAVADLLRDTHLSASVCFFLKRSMMWLDMAVRASHDNHHGEFSAEDFLGLAIERGANEFALSLLKTTEPLYPDPGGKRPLLDVALNSKDGNQSRVPSLALVARLLELGANPDVEWRGERIWVTYFQQINRRVTKEHVPAYGVSPKHRDLSLHTDVARLLVSIGTINAVRETGKSIDTKAIMEALAITFEHLDYLSLVAMLEKSLESARQKYGLGKPTKTSMKGQYFGLW